MKIGIPEIELNKDDAIDSFNVESIKGVCKYV